MKDFFISYTDEDLVVAQWVRETLRSAGYTVIMQMHDFAAGGNFIIDIQSALDAAKHVVAIISPDYLRAEYTALEWTPAIARDPDGRRRILIPVLVRHCELPALLRPRTYVDLVDKDRTTARDLLLNETRLAVATLHAPTSPIAPPCTTSESVRAAIESVLSFQDELSVFAPRFVNHPSSVTRLADYFEWYEDDRDWGTGKGLLLSATYGEVEYLWTDPEYFIPYEAKLLRFRRAGIETRRIFLVGKDLASEAGRLALHRTLLRHVRLGFEPRLHSVRDLQIEMAHLGVHAKMFGVLNGRIAYFFRFDEKKPTMLRTIDPPTVAAAEERFLSLWNVSEPYSRWPGRFSNIPQQLERQIDSDLAAIWEVARTRS